MNSTSDMLNKDIDSLVEEGSSDNELSLSSSLNTQNRQNTKEYTASTEKTLKSISSKPSSQSKTFTVHKVKQVIKEENPNVVGSSSNKIDSLSEDEKFSLGKKTGINIKDDDSYELAKSLAAKDLAAIKGKQGYNPSSIAKSSLSTTPKDPSAVPSFGINGKVLKSFIMTDDEDMDLMPSGIGNITQNDVIREKITDKMGMSDYNKLRDGYKTLSDFATCTGLDDIFGFGNGLFGSDWYNKLNDLLNTAISYDLGWLIGCFLGPIEMLDIKGVNKITKKVGAKGSIKVLDAIESGNDHDKLLKSVKKERATMRNTKSKFSDPEIKVAADNIVGRSILTSAKDYFTPKQNDDRSVNSSISDDTDVFIMKDVKGDSYDAKDFTDYSIGRKKANLLCAIPQ